MKIAQKIRKEWNYLEPSEKGAIQLFVIPGSILGIMTGSLWIGELFKEDIERANLSEYPKSEWGYVDENWAKNLQIKLPTMSIDELRKEISSPAELVEWVSFIDNYFREFHSLINEELSSEQQMFYSQANAIDYYASSRFEGSFVDNINDIHSYIQDYIRFTNLLQSLELEYNPNQESYKFLAKHGHSQDRCGLREAGSTINGRLYAITVMGSSLTDEEKIEAFCKPINQRTTFPYSENYIPSSRLTDIIFNSHPESEILRWSHPINLNLIPDCDEIALAAADLLSDDNYPELQLIMHSKESGGHQVYLINGEGGYGFIGFNPELHYSKPKYKTIKELMVTEFPDFTECSVLDSSRVHFGRFSSGLGKLAEDSYQKVSKLSI